METLMDLPIGTWFYVINGCWKGRIVSKPSGKHVYVEATDRTYKLTYGGCKDLQFIVLEQSNQKIKH